MPKADKHPWQVLYLGGSAGILQEGVVGTYQAPHGHPRGSLSSASTAILGTLKATDIKVARRTRVSWRLSLSQEDVAHFDEGWLVIGCVRHYGGLHSETRFTRMELLLNEEPVDSIRLRDKPDTHDDYFCRLPTPSGFPRVDPFARCQTLYSWVLLKERLATGPEQCITISLEAGAWWDIDYVGFIYKTRPHRPLNVFLCHGKEDKETVKSLYRHLRAAGLQPWMDDVDLGPGDEWDSAIRKAIKAADVVLACMSSTSVSKTGYVQKEIRFALDRADEQPEGAVFIMPVRLDPCTMPERLSKYQWVDLFKRREKQRLVNALRDMSPKHGSL